MFGGQEESERDGKERKGTEKEKSIYYYPHGIRLICMLDPHCSSSCPFPGHHGLLRTSWGSRSELLLLRRKGKRQGAKKRPVF